MPKLAPWVLVAMIAACKAEEPEPAPPVTTEPVALAMDGFDGHCADTVTYEAALDTTAPTDGKAVFDLWDTAGSSGRSEEHILLADSDANDHLVLTLDKADLVSAVTRDETTGEGSTLFSCTSGGELATPDGLTMALRINDADGNLAQCCAFGDEALAVIRGTYPTSSGGTPSDPDQLSTCKIDCQDGGAASSSSTSQ